MDGDLSAAARGGAIVAEGTARLAVEGDAVLTAADGAGLFFDVTLANDGATTDHDFSRLSVVGNAILVAEADDLTLFDSAAADNGAADRGTLGVTAGGALTLDTVRVGGDTPSGENTLTATASTIAGTDIDAGDTTLAVDADTSPGLADFRTVDLEIATDPAGGALAAIALSGGQVRGALTLPFADTLTLRGVGLGADGLGAGGTDVTIAGGDIELDGLRVGGTLTASAGDALRLGRVSAGSLIAAAGAGGIAKIADDELAPFVPATVDRIVSAEPASPQDGRALEDPALELPFTAFDRLLDLRGTTSLTATAGGDILLPSALGGPSGPLHNRFGDPAATPDPAGRAVTIVASADAALEGAGRIVMAQTQVAGDLALRANADNGGAGAGGLAQTGAITVAGATALLTGRAIGAVEAVRADVTLDNPDNAFGNGTASDPVEPEKLAGVSVMAANAALRGADGLRVTRADLTGDLTVGSDTDPQAGDLALTDAVVAGTARLRVAGEAQLARVAAGGIDAAAETVAGEDLRIAGSAALAGGAIDLTRVAAGFLDATATGTLGLRDAALGGGRLVADEVGALFHVRVGDAFAGAPPAFDTDAAPDDLTVSAAGGTLTADAVDVAGTLSLASAGDVVLDRVRAGTLSATSTGGSVLSAARSREAARTVQAFTVEGPRSAADVGIAATDPADTRVRGAFPGEADAAFDALAFDRLVRVDGTAAFDAAEDVVVVRETVPAASAALDRLDPLQLHNDFGALDAKAPGLVAIETAGALRFAGVEAGRLAARSDSDLDGAEGISQDGPLTVTGGSAFLVGHAGGFPHGAPAGASGTRAFVPTGSVDLTDPGNEFGGAVQVVAETLAINARSPAFLLESRIAGTIDVETGGAGPTRLSGTQIGGDATLRASGGFVLDEVSIDGDLDVAGGAGGVSAEAVNVAGDASFGAAGDGAVAVAALDVEGSATLSGSSVALTGAAVVGATTVVAGGRADLRDLRATGRVSAGGEAVAVIDAETSGLEVDAGAGGVEIRRLRDAGSARIASGGAVEIVDAATVGDLTIAAAGDIFGDADGVRLEVGGDFEARSTGGAVRLRANDDAVAGSVRVGGDATLTADTDDVLLTGAVVDGDLTVRAGDAAALAGVAVGGVADVAARGAPGAAPALSIDGLRAGTLATASRGGQSVVNIDIRGDAALTETGADLELGGATVGGALTLDNAAGGVLSRAFGLARRLALVGPFNPAGGGFQTAAAGDLATVFGEDAGGRLAPAQPDQKRVTETVPSADLKIVAPFPGGGGGQTPLEPVAPPNAISVGGETRIDAAGDVALRSPAADIEDNRFAGGIAIGGAGGDIDIESAADLSFVIERPRSGQNLRLALDGAALDLTRRSLGTADARLGSVVVEGADGVTLPATSGRAGDSVLFAQDFILRGATGAVGFLGGVPNKGVLELENAFGGVDLSGSLDFRASPGLAALDLTGAIGGQNTRAAGLLPRPGVTGREYLFNLCVIGDQNACSTTIGEIVRSQVRLDPPTLFDLDLVSLTDVYASFGNEELWSLPPGFLDTTEELPQ